MATTKQEGNSFPFWDVYAAACRGAAEHERSFMRGNETHVVTAVEGTRVLVLTSADPREFKTRITRNDLGKTLAWSSSEDLVALGMRVVLRDGKWEAATLNRG